MNDDNELDAVARLRAADPAAGVEPRAGFVDEVLARTSSESSASAAPATQAAAPVTDIASERARRRSRWLPIAAVAASIAIFGGAGYAVGATTGGPATGGDTTVADGAAPPIPMQGGVEGQTTGEGMMPNDRSMGASTVPGSGGADMMYPYAFGRNSFSSSGLSTTEGTARGFAFDARAASNEETVSELAAALGVEGVPVLQNGMWLVGSQDGTGPNLSVGLDGMLSFSYSNSQINPWQCMEGTDVVGPCEPTGDLPSEEAAIDALRSLIASTGRDPEAFEYASDTWKGSATRMAQAWPVVDGQRNDQPWTLELTTDGVFMAYGSLAELVELGEYDIVSEQEAFERLSDPRFGAQMTNWPIALRDQAATATPEEWVAPTEPPAAPKPGTSLSWPVNDVEIVSARLGLSSQWQPDGSVLVVPAYEFTDAAGGTWSVIAVAESMLDFATE